MSLLKAPFSTHYPTALLPISIAYSRVDHKTTSSSVHRALLFLFLRGIYGVTNLINQVLRFKVI
ncbi:hypothetical protein ACFSR6_14910 [Pedobacter vanadiisoli]|uniref:Uncharacterized protein n=1 Tax=Pedobacter vanadiisoli TaxID=1761975 RepID=A0ABW5MMW2_9SPHI